MYDLLRFFPLVILLYYQVTWSLRESLASPQHRGIPLQCFSSSPAGSDHHSEKLHLKVTSRKELRYMYFIRSSYKARWWSWCRDSLQAYNVRGCKRGHARFETGAEALLWLLFPALLWWIEPCKADNGSHPCVNLARSRPCQGFLPRRAGSSTILNQSEKLRSWREWR